MSTSSVENRIKVAQDLLRKGRILEAEEISKQVGQSAPGVAASLLACEVEQSRSEFLVALRIVDEALAGQGELPALLHKRAQILMDLRHRTEAFTAAARAAELAGADPRLLQAVARIYTQTNAPEQAMPLLQRALGYAPDDPTIVYDTALCHFYLNRMDEAEALLNRALTLVPGNGFALQIRAQLHTQTAESNHVAELRGVLAQPRLRDTDAMLTSFALAKELEDIGEYAASFEALSQGNRIKRRSLSYDVNDDVRAMNNVMTHYTWSALDAIPDGDDTPGPIFIVGMPRTGTTLVERILGSHSGVVSVGEAVDFPIEMATQAKLAHARLALQDTDLVRASLSMDFAELGRRYRTAVQQLARASGYTIDKLPFNFRYCGLIHKALPKARIVHLSRDPMDTCYAVFKTMFINAYHFSYQLDELAEYYVAYRRMMDHWREVMPGVILDLGYEQLVSDPEPQCRRLLEHCGLPWEDQVLEFHRSDRASTTASTAQVRRPFYRTSVQKWRNYARQMQPVLRRLAEAGLVDEDGNPLR